MLGGPLTARVILERYVETKGTKGNRKDVRSNRKERGARSKEQGARTRARSKAQDQRRTAKREKGEMRNHKFLLFFTSEAVKNKREITHTR